MIDRNKGEFNFTMHECERGIVQLQARYAGDKSEAVNGLHYNIVSFKKLTKRQRKNARYRLNKKKMALATGRSPFDFLYNG